MFFVATAAAEGKVNLSPKGIDSLRILSPHQVLWLNLTGSGNETAAHVQENPRMTLMFNAFEGQPMILRLYGKARAIHLNDADWGEYDQHFAALPGKRQMFLLDVDTVQTSCGTGVPLYDYVGEREDLIRWAEKKGESGIRQYWSNKNQISFDGKPTHILEKNT